MSDKPFSEREGFVQPKFVQINDLDKDARTALYNAYLSCSIKSHSTMSGDFIMR